MIIDIQYLNTEPDWDTKKFITEKINKLHSHFDWIMNVNVYMKNEGNDQIKSKIVELKFIVLDDVLYAEARGENFQAAAQEALQRMERQISKYNTRRTSPHMERKSFNKISPQI